MTMLMLLFPVFPAKELEAFLDDAQLADGQVKVGGDRISPEYLCSTHVSHSAWIE
jgi:hypothetical protein